jgi:hypothetical protein
VAFDAHPDGSGMLMTNFRSDYDHVKQKDFSKVSRNAMIVRLLVKQSLPHHHR